MRQFILVAVFTSAFLSSPFLHAAERQLATLQGLSAVVQDGFCRSNAAIRVIAPDASEFSGDKINLQRLIGAIRVPLSMECPSAKALTINGEVHGQQVYQGSVSEADEWALKDKNPAETKYNSGDDRGYGEVRKASGQVKEYFTDYQVLDIYGKNINELTPYSVMAEKTTITEWLQFSKDKRQEVINMVSKEWKLIFKMTEPIYQCHALGGHPEAKLKLQKQLMEYGLNAKERERCIALGPGQKH